MTAPCPSCGSALPSGPARVCLTCFALVEALPEGMPLGPRWSPPKPSRPGVYWGLLLLVGLAVTLTALWVMRGGPAARPQALFVIATGLAAYAVLLRVFGPRSAGAHPRP